jgi:hypothetical protein
MHLINNQNMLERTAAKYVQAVIQDDPDYVVVDKFELFLVAYGYITQQEATQGDARGAPKLKG